MSHAIIYLILFKALLAEERPCVCYSRNFVSSSKQLRRATLSAWSARGVVDARTCLITDNTAIHVPPNTFDIIHYVNETRSPLVDTLAASDLPQARIARSRIARLHYLANPPCTKTLFVDDDTYWCPAQKDKVLNLEPLFSGFPVRAFMFYKTQNEHAIDTAARNCIQQASEATLKATVDCYDNAGASIPRGSCAGAQGGAIAIRRSPSSNAFAKAWLDEYTRRDIHAVRQNPRKFDWYDQSALSRLSQHHCKTNEETNSPTWSLGHLPYLMNYRAVKKYAFRGHVFLLHQKALMPSSNFSFDQASHRLDAVCNILNAKPLDIRVLTIYESPLGHFAFGDASKARRAQPSIKKKQIRSQAHSPHSRADTIGPRWRRSQSRTSATPIVTAAAESR